MRFLAIGHITRDVTPEGHTLGGAVTYAAVMARRLGAEVTVVTRAHPDDAAHSVFDGVEVINLPSPHTTTFQNFYQPDGHRLQQVQVVAAPIMASDVPAHLLKTDLVFLGPVCQEIDPDLASRFDAIIGSSPQGWLREWDDRGRIFAIPWYTAGRILPYLDTVVMSEHDMSADPGLRSTLVRSVPVVAITHGASGATVYTGNQPHTIPARPAVEVDATGAGDVFASAFLIRLWETKDPLQAGFFASVAGSLAVEGVGIEGVPNRAGIEAYLQQHPAFAA